MTEAYDYIWGFAVAAVSEARELREAGIKKPVLILGYTFEEDYEWMATNSIRPAVFTYEMGTGIFRCSREGRCLCSVHVAVDTGMSRIGVTCDGPGADLAEQIGRLPGLFIEGVFTHFAKADETDKTFTKTQIERFAAFCADPEKTGI